MTNTKRNHLMIYGANGYTGRLITELAVAKGYKPIVAGRNKAAIQEVAALYGLPYMVVDLNNKEALSDAVLMADVVMHCAGPFVHTALPMLEACMKFGTHYLDITGEIPVFEMIAARNNAIKESGIMAMPGTGFDVVPTDCLAAYLKKQLPTATHLTLAFAGLGGGVSHGTATTMLLNMGKGGAVRLNGKITPVPDAFKTAYIDFGGKMMQTVTIPWGDVSTAYHSTGIPNIEVFMAVNNTMLRGMQLLQSLQWLVKSNFVQRFLQARIDNLPAGPSAQQRQKAKSLVWGQVQDEKGNTATARLTGPEGYTLTALTAMAIVEKVLCGDAPTGFQTPSMAYGADFILEIKGVTREDLLTQRNIKVD
ncbi:MAG TPA: saccharopine dehydrogenase NADP-binding domain-containing protein [Chitinophagales bacterium]|mgnify:CR=1 FL=1|nr:saccharopine dehydrogenase NADP-binding domain-containing protein [Chitinophagales bacterium]HRK26110.1 saccharopine dehydrogenase NADP-binding domain-containing protein [Chitinophagales bacterium]